MGAEFCTLEINSLNKSEVERQFKSEQERDRHENGHSYSGGMGMAKGLNFESKTFENGEQACNYLEVTCKKWGPAIAVVVMNESNPYFLIGAMCSS